MSHHTRSVHSDLRVAQEQAYVPNNLILTNLTQEEESQEYAACTFNLNQYRIIFRTAKITPTKIGQFVTFWKRIGSGPIMPYDISDHFDFLVVSVRPGEHLGQFIFPKDVLLKQNVLSQHGNGGKRAIRVYPTWDTPDNATAHKTQNWQTQYFFEIMPNKSNPKLIHRLFSV